MSKFANGQSVRIADVNTVSRNMVGHVGIFMDGFVVTTNGHGQQEHAGPYADEELEPIDLPIKRIY